MTAALERAFAKASCLSKAAQKQLAEQMHEDLDGEMAWDQTLAQSQPTLERLAAKACEAKLRGKIVRKGFDQL